jgi:hypothetical protein
MKESGQKRKRWRLFVLLALVLLLLAGVGTFYALSNRKPAAPAIPPAGEAFFVSSGQLKEGYSQGINDQLQIVLHYVPDPTPGMSYYAWLLSDKGVTPQTSLLLGKLSVNQGNVQFLYKGDAQHTNLLGTLSRFLITEESASKAPVSPSTDQQAWRFYAELPQIRAPLGLHRRVIDTLRDLLYDASHLQPLKLRGGSDIRLLRNTEKVLEWASSAWGSKDAAFIYRQVVRILDYLDGASLVAQDVPPGTPLLVNPLLAQVPLVDIKPKQPLLSYIDRMNNQLSGLVHQPGATATMLQLSRQADAALLGNLNSWFGQMRQDAKQLVFMTNAQLSQPAALSLLNDLQLYANESLVGRLDPSTDSVQDGVVQIHEDVQRLAGFDVRSYNSH